jgi:DNA-binding beta-propeller fold protein YncE
LRRRTASLKPAWAIAALALVIVLSAGITIYVNRQHELALPSGIEIAPANASVFAGSSIAFTARLIGGDGKSPVQWSVVGPGTISPEGVYVAPDRPGQDVVVVARAGRVSVSAPVRVTGAPAGIPLVLVACYESSALDVRDAATSRRVGMLSTPELPAGMAVDASRRLAFVAAKGRVTAVDLTTMTAYDSAPLRNSRFSGAVLLAGGYFATTDNNASKGGPGIFIFRIGADHTPVVASTAPAGETPEGIVAQPDGRVFYVTNVNSDELIRYAFDGRGNARETGRAATGTRPFGIALAASRGLLFVADNDTATVSGARSHPGLEEFSLPSLRRVGASRGTGSKDALPLGVAVDENTGRVFVTNEGDANVAVFSLPALVQIATLPTAKWPWTPYLDRTTSRLYVPSAKEDVIDVFDTHSLRRLGAPISTCSYPTNVTTVPRRAP